MYFVLTERKNIKKLIYTKILIIATIKQKYYRKLKKTIKIDYLFHI